MLAREDKIEEALAQYRLARGFDPSLEVAALEARQLQAVLDARQKLEEGFVHYREKRYAAARQVANEVLKVDPHSVRAAELLKLLEAKHQAVVMDGVELDLASKRVVVLFAGPILDEINRHHQPESTNIAHARYVADLGPEHRLQHRAGLGRVFDQALFQHRYLQSHARRHRSAPRRDARRLAGDRLRRLA